MAVDDSAMRSGSTFTGIKGIDLGLERAGIETVWMVENNEHCRSILRMRSPNVPLYGDIKEVNPDGLATVDVLTGGFPCQDLSVAGKRAGLAGIRSGLFFEFLRIADALAPAWLLVENVPGLLSSNDGEDFAVLLEGLTGFRPAVPAEGWRTGGVCVGPKRGAAWRVLDSRYFGVAQRRRRVFLVCHPRAESAVAVLFEPESCGGDPAQGGASREDIAGSVGGGFTSSGPRSFRFDLDNSGAYIPTGGAAADGGGAASTHRMRGFGDYAEDDAAGALKRRDHKDATDLVAYSLRSDAPREGVAKTRGNGSGLGPVVFRKGKRAQTDQDDETWVEADASNTVKVNQFDAGDVRATELVVDVPTVLKMREGVAVDSNGEAAGKGPLVGEGVSFTLSQGGSEQTLFEPSSVRRLTPTEYERLQGFPDGWTCLKDWNGAPYDPARCTCPDGPRYAACGNAVTVPVAEWIGRRIVSVDAANRRETSSNG